MTELSFNNNNHHQSLLVPYFPNKKVYDSDRKIITKKTSKIVEKTNNHIHLRTFKMPILRPIYNNTRFNDFRIFYTT